MKNAKKNWIFFQKNIFFEKFPLHSPGLSGEGNQKKIRPTIKFTTNREHTPHTAPRRTMFIPNDSFGVGKGAIFSINIRPSPSDIVTVYSDGGRFCDGLGRSIKAAMKKRRKLIEKKHVGRREWDRQIYTEKNTRVEINGPKWRGKKNAGEKGAANG